MNCRQARALLAIYREYYSDPTERTETTDLTRLEEHLAGCSSCREIQQQYAFVGEGIRALPQVEPSLTARTNLMQALAAEHVRHLQRTATSAASTPTPAFLAPYLRDLARDSRHSPATAQFAAFASADTGPLPRIQSLRRRPYRLNHFAVIGIAASFLILLMAGGLTSLLLSASNGGSVPSNTNTGFVRASEVQSLSYTTNTEYTHVVSALPDASALYYTATNNAGSSWQLEELNKSTNISLPLLPAATPDQLFVLESTQDWLVWLQIEEAKVDAGVRPDGSVPPQQAPADTGRAWSLNVASIAPLPTKAFDPSTITPLVQKQTFKQSTVPSWITKPIQGAWLTGNTLLVTMIDDKGNSQLVQYQLQKGKSPTQTVLHTANNGHILSSPTANTTNTAIYWAEEWYSPTGGLCSSIWTQQVINASLSKDGRWVAHPETQQYLFRQDTKSFRPQIVEDTLFLLSTNTDDKGNSTTTATATTTPNATATTGASTGATAQATVTPIPVDTTSALGGTTQSDPLFLTPQIDEVQSGHILSFTVNGVSQNLPHFDNNKIVSSLQGGSRFLLWQNSAKAFEIYDVETNQPVNVGPNTVARDAAFLTVNGETGVWVSNPSTSFDPTVQNTTPAQITFNTINWPFKTKGRN